MMWGGRAVVRGVLSMSAVVAARRHPLSNAFSQRWRTAGQAPKVVRVACMRQLLTMLNAMVTHRTPWRLSAQGT
jgi:transposase